MKNFAQINADNKVVNIIQCDDDATESSCNNLFNGNFKETWLDGSQRQRYAQVDGSYDPQKDVFIKPKPYSSWVLDSNNEWQAPITYPNSTAWGTDDDVYPILWDDNNQRWTGTARTAKTNLVWNSTFLSWEVL